MKRKYLFRNTGRISIAIGLLAMTLLSSCLKDKSPGTIDFSKSPALVGFQYNGFSAVPLLTKLFAQPNLTKTVEVTLSVASLTLSTPVTVNIAEDDASGNTYIAADLAANGNVDHILPTSDYSIANGGKITINPGQQIVKLSITYAGDKIDFSQNYVLPLKIVSATGATIASNLQTVILTIALQSIYEGEYSVTGTFVDVTNASLTQDGDFPENIDLLTVGPFVVDYYDLTYNIGYGTPLNSGGQLSHYGSFDPEFDFDPAGSGKIIAVVNAYGQGANNRTGVLDPSGVNAATGTPGTDGFKIQVKYIMHQINTGVDRAFFNDTMTYIGPAK